jgi:hypothetical protein
MKFAHLQKRLPDLGECMDLGYPLKLIEVGVAHIYINFICPNIYECLTFGLPYPICKQSAACT